MFQLLAIISLGERRKKRGSSVLPKIDNGRNRVPPRTRSGPGRLGRPQSNGSTSDVRPQERHQLVQFPASDGREKTVIDFQPGVKPITLELQHGNQKQSVSLPTNNLDKSKKYYVTFTINKPSGEQILPNKVTLQEPSKLVVEEPCKIFDRTHDISGLHLTPEKKTLQQPCKIFDRATEKSGGPVPQEKEAFDIFDRANTKLEYFDRTNEKMGIPLESQNGVGSIFDRANIKLGQPMQPENGSGNIFNRAKKSGQSLPPKNGNGNIFNRANDKSSYFDSVNEKLEFDRLVPSDDIPKSVLQNPCKFFDRVKEPPAPNSKFPAAT